MRVFNYIPSVTVATAVATSTAIPFGDQEGGRFHVPVGSSITALTWYDSMSKEADATFLAAYDELGVAVTQTVAAGYSYEIPTSLAGSAMLKAVGDAAGTINVCIKG